MALDHISSDVVTTRSGNIASVAYEVLGGGQERLASRPRAQMSSSRLAHANCVLVEPAAFAE